MLQHICDCTVAEARQCWSESWNLSLAGLKAFVAVCLTGGERNGRNTGLEDLWAKEWGLPFFSTTMSRNRYREIILSVLYLSCMDRTGPGKCSLWSSASRYTVSTSPGQHKHKISCQPRLRRERIAVLNASVQKNKTTKACMKCLRAVCGQCTVKVCSMIVSSVRVADCTVSFLLK